MKKIIQIRKTTTDYKIKTTTTYYNKNEQRQ